MYDYLFKEDWIIPESRPPNKWPQDGNIRFQDFDLKYREGLPLFLKHITCVITPGEKVNTFCRSFGDIGRGTDVEPDVDVEADAIAYA